MQTRDFILLAYKGFGGTIRGKTSLQKKIYFLNSMLKQNMKFAPHYYGPYSTEVADANSELKALGYITEKVIRTGAISSQGWEIARHDFELNEDGNKLAARKIADYPEDWDEISKATEVINNAGDVDYIGLSIAAKAYFIWNSKGCISSLESIKESAKSFGWNTSEEELEKAFEFLKKINLVTSDETSH